MHNKYSMNIFILASVRQRAFRFDFLRNAFSDIFSLGAIDYSYLGSAYKFRTLMLGII